jgi:SAM-dependent methyltransferase
MTLGELPGKTMLELGNQHISDENRRACPGILERTGKQYFENRGVKHTSIDLNAEDGALPIDLSRPIGRPDWRHSFDIVTNAGTSEHVEPFEAQYECFRNIHACLKPGGIAVHIVPSAEGLSAKGRWRDHCNNYYSRRFFDTLAEHNAYRVVSFQFMDELILTCLQKTEDRPFMADRSAFLEPITRREGGIIYPGINDNSVGAWTRLAWVARKKIGRLRKRVRRLTS